MVSQNKEPFPQVSVVLATYYHRPALLARSIESILYQTLADFELIIVNDGAPNNTRKILNDYALKDSRIKILHQQNKGLGAARNLGVRHARAAYIAFMDDDDRSLPERLNVQLNFLQQHSQFAACICHYYTVETPDGRTQRKKLAMKRHDALAISDTELKNILPVPFTLSPMTMITKEAFKICGGYRPLFQKNEDLDFTLRFQEKFRVGVVPKPLYEYTSPQNDFSRNMTTAKPIQNLKYTLACYISAWYRRNLSRDPVEQGPSLDEIIHIGSQLSKAVRFHILYQCSDYSIEVFLANPNLSAANVRDLCKVLCLFDGVGDLRFLYHRKQQLLTSFCKQRKIYAVLNLMIYAFRRFVSYKLKRSIGANAREKNRISS